MSLAIQECAAPGTVACIIFYSYHVCRKWLKSAKFRFCKALSPKNPTDSMVVNDSLLKTCENDKLQKNDCLYNFHGSARNIHMRFVFNYHFG